MKRTSIYLTLFLFGVGVAFVITQLLEVRPRATDEHSASFLNADYVTAKFDSYSNVERFAPEDFANLLGDLERGRYDKAQLVNWAALSSSPNFVEILQPALRRASLEGLSRLLSDADLTQWTSDYRASDSVQGSEARKFISKLGELDTPLGSYLEGAALLLHALVSQSRQGVPFRIESAYDYVQSNWNRFVVEPKVRSFGPPATILVDPVFLETLERKRCQEVERHLSNSPENIVPNISLSLSLTAAACSPNVFAAVAELLESVGSRGSTKLRFKLLMQEGETHTFAQFADLDERVKGALAGLYAVAAQDAVDANESEVAYRFFLSSTGLKPGLASQAELYRIFSDARSRAGRVPSVSVRRTTEGDILLGLESAVEGQVPADAPIALFVGWIGKIVAAAILLLLAFVIARRLQTSLKAEIHHTPTFKPRSRVVVSPRQESGPEGYGGGTPRIEVIRGRGGQPKEVPAKDDGYDEEKVTVHH